MKSKAPYWGGVRLGGSIAVALGVSNITIDVGYSRLTTTSYNFPNPKRKNCCRSGCQESGKAVINHIFFDH